MKNPIVSFLLVQALLAVFARQACARDISADEAAQAAAAWVRQGGADAAKTVSTTRDDEGSMLFHVVQLAGGGTVVTSAESGVMPVIAFFGGDAQTVSDGHPLWDILRADMSNRLARVNAVRQGESARKTRQATEPFAAEEAAWAALLGKTIAPKRGTRAAAIADGSNPSDLRRAPILVSTWDQVNGAANYYTPPYDAGDPENYPCGCVALAGAQIANFWQFPTEPVAQTTRTCWVDDVETNCTTIGGTYDWSNMPPLDFYSSPLSVVQRQAIGKLCYDFGVATQMNWGPDETGGSGTVSTMLAEAFTGVFGYANAMAYTHFGGNVIPDDLVEKAVLANLDAGCPVVLSLAGHSVAADGYGYSASQLYTHLNFGWDGRADAWYNLPDVDDSAGTGYTSSVLNQVVYNIFPSMTGELLTGRVLDGDGDPVVGATVIATSGSSTATATTDAKGIYALHVASDRVWTVVATDGQDAGSLTVEVGESSSAVFTRTAQGSIASYSGMIGNSWGNDVTLGVDVPADDTFFVDEANGNDANDGRSWDAAKASIQAAVDVASDGDTIYVGDGRYEPISTENKAIKIRSLNGPETTFIDGSLQWARGTTNRCATLGTNTSEIATILVGLTLVNGIPPNTNETAFALSAGGGALGGTLRDCVLTNNAAKNGGGACRSILQNCTVCGNAAKFGGGTYHGSLADCIVADNASTSSGGGIYALSDTVVTNCTISGNRGGTYGGGVYAYDKSLLFGCTITNNIAGNGGGCSGGTLSDCLIVGNTATGMGGGTYNAVALTHCTVTNNVTGTYGGGCYGGTLSFCEILGNAAMNGGGTSSATLTDCTLACNTASTSGGGMHGGSATRCGIVNNTAISSNGGGSSGAVLDNCIVVHNAAGANGGGAANGALTNCTVYANTAETNGGGAYLASLANCIVWGNTASQNQAVYAFSSKPCVYSCLDQDLAGDYNVGNINANPLFVGDSDWHLQAGSPCINAGTNDLAVGERDFYGNARLVGGTVDMGASEYQPTTGYAAWAAENGLGAADAVTDGQQNLIRYVFDRPSGAFSPFTDVTFQEGCPVLWFQSFNSEVSGVTVTILSSTNLLDWSHPVKFQLEGPPFDFYGVILTHPDASPTHFYKFKVEATDGAL